MHFGCTISLWLQLKDPHADFRGADTSRGTKPCYVVYCPLVSGLGNDFVHVTALGQFIQSVLIFLCWVQKTTKQWELHTLSLAELSVTEIPLGCGNRRKNGNKRTDLCIQWGNDAHSAFLNLILKPSWWRSIIFK